MLLAQTVQTASAVLHMLGYHGGEAMKEQVETVTLHLTIVYLVKEPHV